MTPRADCPFRDTGCVAGECHVCNPRPTPRPGLEQRRRVLTKMLTHEAYADEVDQALLTAALADLEDE